jgi:Ran GTPase-activating protein (RanGAP) involved in mRNA processing and transport
MSVSNDSTDIRTIDDGRPLLSPTFLEFCDKVRNNDPSILPEAGRPFKIRRMCEREGIELAGALLENTCVTYLELEMSKYTASSAATMAKYVRTSKHLQRIRILWNGQGCEEILCCFLPAIQESMSLKELHMELRLVNGPSNVAFENMLAHTQSLQSLSLRCPDGLLVEETAVAAARSGLKNNITLRELTLDVSRSAMTVSPFLTSLGDDPLLRKLCVRGHAVDLTELETLLLSDNSKITELEIHRSYGGLPIVGLTGVLQALGLHPALTELRLYGCPIDREKASLLRVVLCTITSLHTLVFTYITLGSAGLAELAPALYRNTSIKVLDISRNNLMDLESTGLLRDILRSNKTITTLDLTGNTFGRTTGAVECIAEGLGSNSTLLNIDLSSCAVGDGGVSTLAQNLGSRNTTLQKLTLGNTTLQKLTLGNNAIGDTGVGVLLETMEQSSNRIRDLDLRYNILIGIEGAILLARSLGNNALSNLTRLSLSQCGIGDDGFVALMSALEQNKSLLHLDLPNSHGYSERAYGALAESLPEIKVLQQVDLSWCRGLASAMPLLLAGLRKNTSLFRFQVANCTPSSVPPTPEETAKCASGWMQETERLGYRNRFRALIRAPKERLPPRGLWHHALARFAELPDVVFDALRSKPKLVPSEDTEDKEAAEDTGNPKKRKRGDE